LLRDFLDNNPFIERHDLCADIEAEFALKIFLVEEDSDMRVLFREIGKISRGMLGVQRRWAHPCAPWS
jgi:hypothetical protein